MTRSEVIDRHRLLQKKTPRYTCNFTQGMKSIQVEEKEETVKTKTSLSLLYRSFLDDDEVNSRRKDRTKSCFIHHLFPLFRNRCLFGLNMKMMKMTKTRDYKEEYTEAHHQQQMLTSCACKCTSIRKVVPTNFSDNSLQKDCL